MNDKKTYYNLIMDVSFVFFALYYVAAQLLDKVFVGDSRSMILVLIMVVNAFAMPLLFSGMCGRFLDNGVHLSANYVYRRILPPVLVATVMWWFFGGLAYWKLSFQGDYRIYALSDSLFSVLRAPYCLFFYPMVLMIIVLYPLLKRLMEDRKYMKKISIISICFCLMGCLVSYLSIFPDELGMMLAFIAYIFMAIYVEQTEFKTVTRFVIYGLGVLSTGIIFYMTLRYSQIQTEIDYTWVEEATVFVIIQLFAVLVLIRQLSRRLKAGFHLSYWLRELASHSYIYIFVFAMIESLLYSLDFVGKLPVIQGFLLVCFLSFVLTVMVSATLVRLPVISLFAGGFRNNGSPEKDPPGPVTTKKREYIQRPDERPLQL